MGGQQAGCGQAPLPFHQPRVQRATGACVAPAGGPGLVCRREAWRNAVLPPPPPTTMAPRRTGSGFDPSAMQAHAAEAARLLKAIGNEKRLQVLCLLAEGERSVSEINALLDLSQSALS